MHISRDSLQAASDKGIITPGQAEDLWAFLLDQRQDTPSFNFVHVLYYLGGMVAIGAMSLFMTLGWERFGGWGMFVIALVYGALALGLAEYFQARKGLLIPAGIMAALVVVVTPLAVYGLQTAMGWLGPSLAFRHYHTHINAQWLVMELATLAAGAGVLWRFSLPFSTMPVAVTLWYMSMDLAPFLFSNPDLTWDLRKKVSLWFGLAMIVLALLVDWRSRSRKDFAFWLHLFGALAFWGGLSLMGPSSEMGRLLYCFINLLMVLAGAVINRRVFAVLGALGMGGYLAHLAYDVFKDSWLFPLALTAIGLGVIMAGIWWQRHQDQLNRLARRLLPASMHAIIERGRSR